jgi:hypothetical protein
MQEVAAPKSFQTYPNIVFNSLGVVTNTPHT